ncbi:Hypothetical predicted protein [Octopus vulgaris]|uniref:Uncharacterized protein n=1 Tax=Octopus vulgaris TaxID=6645 RepID=A0AA36FD03_OCTVU|nr:Hypothetical predicted protein [Octopus vulgaris]
MSSWKNYYGKADKVRENKAKTRRLFDPMVSQKNGSPTPVNNQVDKDKEAEEATTGSPSVAVVLQRNGVFTPLDNQRNASLPPEKKGKNTSRNIKKEGEKKEKEKMN